MTTISYNTYKPIVWEKGHYDCKINDVQLKEGMYGPQLQVYFNIENENLEYLTVMEYVRPQISDKYPLFKSILEVAGLGKDESGNLELESLIGLKGTAVVDHREGKDGAVYLTVTRFSKKA